MSERLRPSSAQKLISVDTSDADEPIAKVEVITGPNKGTKANINLSCIGGELVSGLSLRPLLLSFSPSRRAERACRDCS